MSDLVTHLREIACNGHPIGDDAADEIERLEARVEKLEKALGKLSRPAPIWDYAAGVPEPSDDEPGLPRDWEHSTLESFVDNNYWHNPEDAIGDIRRFIGIHKQ